MPLLSHFFSTGPSHFSISISSTGTVASGKCQPRNACAEIMAAHCLSGSSVGLSNTTIGHTVGLGEAVTLDHASASEAMYAHAISMAMRMDGHVDDVIDDPAAVRSLCMCLSSPHPPFFILELIDILYACIMYMPTRTYTYPIMHWVLSVGPLLCNGILCRQAKEINICCVESRPDVAVDGSSTHWTLCEPQLCMTLPSLFLSPRPHMYS